MDSEEEDHSHSHSKEHRHHHKHQHQHQHKHRDKEEQTKDPSSSRKRHHHEEVSSDRHSHRSKKHKHGDDESGERRHSKSSKSKSKKDNLTVVESDEDVWVEKDLGEGGERILAADIPTSDSLTLKSHVDGVKNAPPLPPTAPTESKLKRDEWMLLEPSTPVLPVPATTSSHSSRVIHPDNEPSLTEEYGEPEGSKRTLGGGVDYFSNLGTEKKRKQRPEAPDPSQRKISHLEINPDLNPGINANQSTPDPPEKPKNVPGGMGSIWRMRKLQRVYETAEEEDRPIEEVARDRYETFEEFEEAKEERRILDERNARRGSDYRGRESLEGSGAGAPGGGRASLPEGRNMDTSLSSSVGSGGEKRWMFTDVGNPESRPSSRNSFRRPVASSDSFPGTPEPSRRPPPPPQTPDTSVGPIANPRVDALRSRPSFGTNTGTSSPIPSALTPTAVLARRSSTPTKKRALSPNSLNKLQAKAVKANLMGLPDAAALQKQFDEERQRAEAGGTDAEDGDDHEGGAGSSRVEMVPTIDGRGRLYDIGSGKNEPRQEARPGNRKPKEKYFETRDRKTGEVLRVNADDDTTSLGDMLRQERFGAGMADQKDMDAELARAITTDARFQDDLEYMDDNAEKLGRKKMRSDALKRQFAINDYARTQKALASCPYCYGENDEPPKAPVVAMGTRAYLSCTIVEELLDGHCYIVPIQHHLSMLEGDDDMWDEVKNFMKCLIRMAEASGKGVIFFETVLNLKWQKHTVIECVPVPHAQFDELPGYFKESILASEAEWSQHKKLIDFSARPGGFRRSMVPNLPYFMVQWDYRGEKGYGHVIEGVGDSAAGGDEAEGMVDEGDKGGGEFMRWFAGEVIGNVLDLEPRKWRRPRKMDFRLNKQRVDNFSKNYAKFDWTGMLGRPS